jgi:hypothetical protein
MARALLVASIDNQTSGKLVNDLSSKQYWQKAN